MRALPLFLLLACRTTDLGNESGEADSGETSGEDSASGETDSPTDTEDSEHTDEPEDTDPPEPLPVVRFLALGDAGEGNDTQYKVGEAMARVCLANGCDFAIYLGDNFYDTGVSGADDEQFQEKFELPYAGLSIPFYPALGNHDYGGEGAGWELWKGEYYVDYSASSSKWIMPDLYYTHDHGHARFFALDTTQVFWGITGDQLQWLLREQAASNLPWRIAYGHHPYRSNGPHGNAGEYEGLPWLPVVNGEAIKTFMDAGVCGLVDVYLCGHDHSLQWLANPCAGTELIVSGAGAKTTELDGENPNHYQSDEPGFVWIEIEGDTFTGRFYDEDGNLSFERSFTRTLP